MGPITVFPARKIITMDPGRPVVLGVLSMAADYAAFGGLHPSTLRSTPSKAGDEARAACRVMIPRESCLMTLAWISGRMASPAGLWAASTALGR